MRFLLSLLLVLVAVPAGAASICKTNGSGLNLRSSGSIHARRQATLPAGSSFDVVGRSSNGQWLRVNAGGRTGWVYGGYVCGPASSSNGPTSIAGSAGASAAECAAPRPEPAAIDPLEGVDPFCESCVASRLESFGRMLDDAARQQAGVSRVQDTLAAVLAAEETGSRTPDYQQITVDSGGITYGAYQADRRSGELAKLLREYVKNATPSAETRALARHADMLAGGKGAALDRSSELKRLLRNAGNDPVMQKAQTDFFRSHHLEPALAKAAAAGIRSPLGASIWLDLTVNGGLDAVVAAARRAVPRVQTPVDEARFLKAMIDARERRYRNLASNGMRKYLPGWLSRNADFRKLLAAGNLDLTGNVPLPAKGFSLCGGSTTDAAAFRSWMGSLARTS